MYYRYSSDANEYNSVQLLVGERESILEELDTTTPCAKTWTPVAVEGFADNPGIDGDFPSLNDDGGIPLFSERALNALEPLVSGSVEALPILYPGGKSYFMIHVMDVIDCLDEAKSTVNLNRATKRVSSIWQYAFRYERMKGKHLFRLPLQSGGIVLVSEEFRILCERHGLEGLLFRALPLAGE